MSARTDVPEPVENDHGFMSLLVDPHICPDCRSLLDPERTCTGCGLRLTGSPAAELWQLLQRADTLVQLLRAQPYAVSPGTSTAASLRPAAPPAVASPLRTTSRRPSVSVPAVLLSLGALCVLVAAIVFTAVTWSSLGLGAKAAIMLGVTSLFAAGATVLTARGLRGAAETLWSIVAVLVVVDLVAAYGADLAGFGDMPGRHAAALTGAVLLVLAISVNAWATATSAGHLNSMVGTAAIGGLAVTVAEVLATGRPAVAATIAIALTLAFAALVARSGSGLRPTAYAIGANTALSWTVLLAVGIDRSSGTDVTHWWQDLTGWPLLVAAGYAALLTVRAQLPVAIRVLGSAASLTALSLFALGGVARESTTITTACAVAVALAAISAYAGRVWSIPAALMSSGALILGSCLVAVRPLAVINGLPTTGPADASNLGLHLPTAGVGLSPWTAIAVAVAVTITAAGLLRYVPEPLRIAARTGWIALVPAVLAVGAATAYLESEPRLVLGVLVWFVVLTLAAGAAVMTRQHAPALGTALLVGAYLAVLGLRLAVPSHLLVALLASALAAGLAVAYLRSHPDGLHGALSPGLAGGALLMTGYAGTHWPYLLGGAGDAAGIVLVAIAGLALLGAAPGARTGSARLTLEAVAVTLGLVATRFPVDPEVSVLTLTVLGTALALTATLNRDREVFSWGAVGLLGIATVLRLDLGVDAPELYTVPAAALLIAGGTYRLRTDDGVSSLRALSSGLVLGLTPSLLIALDAPVTPRGAVIAAAGVLVLAAGVRARWTAPVLAGAATVALLAMRHLGPVAEAVPRWISLGCLGLVFLMIGITWEARRRNAATADQYLASLR